jgi:hypothetical protein
MRVFHNPDYYRVDFLDERFYTNNVKFLPSVTTILEVFPKGYGFTEWLKQVGYNADEIVRKAAEQGSKIHNAIDDFLKGYEITWQDSLSGKINFTAEEWKMLMRFVEFYTSYEPVVIASEATFISEKLGFAGTLDMVCEINGQLWLIDYKSSNAIHDTHELQISAYAMLWNEVNERKIDHTGILHLKALTRGADKYGKKIQGEGWQLKTFAQNYQDTFKIFLHTQAIWQYNNPDPKPKNLVYPDRFSIENLQTLKDLKQQQYENY